MSYGYNLVLAGWYDGNVGQEFARSLAQVRRPTDVFAIADSSHTRRLRCPHRLGEPMPISRLLPSRWSRLVGK
jgi:hypothetical protein